MSQLALFGRQDAVAFDATFANVERIPLADGAWLDLARGWLSGHERVFESLHGGVEWRSENRVMYERVVDVPRQFAVLEGPDTRVGFGAVAGLHPLFAAMRGALDARYATAFERLSVALYRDGRDSVAWHGDYVARRMPEAFVATVSVGAPRKFMIRPTGGGASRSLSLGWGDLLVMGGSCQRTHQHAVPKVQRAAPRVAIMFRPVWDEHDPDAAPTPEQAATSRVRGA